MGYDDILDHLWMISDGVRTEAFRRAINAVVRPGDVVIDLGSGTGILACFASSARAARVHAIERTRIVAAARHIAEDSGVSNVEFFEGDSARFSVTERADVLISEWMGHFAFSEWMLDPLIDVRRRTLKQEGVVVPADISLHAMLVSTSTLHESLSYLGTGPYGLDFRFVADWPLQMVHPVRLVASDVAPPIFDLATLKLRDVDRTPGVLETEATCERSIRAYGLCGWFSSNLAPGISLDTGPLSPRTHWMQLYFPFPAPVEVPASDRVRVSIWPVRAPGMSRTLWRWRVSVGGQVRVDANDMAQAAWLNARSREASRERAH